MLARSDTAGARPSKGGRGGVADPGILSGMRDKLAGMGYSDGAQLLRSYFPELVSEAEAEGSDADQGQPDEGPALPPLEADGAALDAMRAEAAQAPEVAPAAEGPAGSAGLEAVAGAAQAEQTGEEGEATAGPDAAAFGADLASLSTALGALEQAPGGIDAVDDQALEVAATEAPEALAAPASAEPAPVAPAVSEAAAKALAAPAPAAEAPAPEGPAADDTAGDVSPGGGSPDAALLGAAQEVVSTGEPQVVRGAKRTLGERMGADVSGVPVHLDSPVAHDADADGVARDGAVHLALGEDALATPEGQEVLAHELIHVAQGRAQGPEQPESSNEEEADRLAKRLVRGGGGRPASRAPRHRTLHKKAKKAGKPAAQATPAGKSPRDKKLLKIMKKHGIVHRGLVLAEARRANIPLSLACSMLVQETGGGHNVFGHDAVKPGQVWGGNVTKQKYKKYKKLRKAGYGMQGVGPMQLTWYTLQDQADALGGCWKPKWNLRVGFEHLRGLIDSYGKFSGVRAYNGSGSAATAYANTVLARQKSFHGWFKAANGLSTKPGNPAKPGSQTGGVAPTTGKPPKPAKPDQDDRDLTKKQVKKALRWNARHNKTKFEIRRIQEAVHVARTGKLDAATIQAIADFQDETGLAFDGMVGPHTWKRIRLHLRRSHGMGKGKVLTRLERREGVRYNKKRKVSPKNVRKFQKYLGVSADGVIGPKTTEAIARFQRKRGMPAHGWLTPYTVKVLKKWIKKNKGGKAGWPGSGASNAAKLKWAMKRAKKLGLWITSTTGGQHAPGSYHYQGRAFDCAGSASNMAAFYKATRWTNPTELFYDPLGGVKYGQDIGPIGGHSDHVHIAY